MAVKTHYIILLYYSIHYTFIARQSVQFVYASLQAKQENGSGEHLSLAVLLVVVDSAKKLPVCLTIFTHFYFVVINTTADVLLIAVVIHTVTQASSAKRSHAWPRYV